MSSAPPLPPGYLVSADPAWLDLPLIHAYLARESYWAPSIPPETVRRSIANSVCLGAYHQSMPGGPPRQVGFARVISDRATFAYLCDVFVLPDHRGKGLSKALVAAALGHPELLGLRRWMLVTKDAQSLYARFGFVKPVEPDRYMERVDRDIYRRQNQA
ncbi:MAG: GNAT family N-acetyltransferase [Phycisphaerae bacterium]|nr:GNAT family N-acetyltransferase [Phycisphaerae bacterium]